MLDFDTSFSFYTLIYALSLILTLLILSSLTAAYKAFTAFLASFLALFSAYITFFVLIQARSTFLNASFSAILAYTSRILAAEKYIGFIYSSLKTLSLFPRTLPFFSSFNALINPFLICRSSAAYINSFISALKSFLSFSFVGFL